MKNRYAKMSIIILFLIAIDQIVKLIVVNTNTATSNPNFIENYGGAFGIAGNSTLFLILVNIVILGIIIKFIMSQRDRVETKTLVSFTFILAGGFSNLIDRIARGFVVDYIDVTKIFDFPVFNFADILIVVGWIMLFALILTYWYKEVRIKNYVK